MASANQGIRESGLEAFVQDDDLEASRREQDAPESYEPLDSSVQEGGSGQGNA
jgi:hypothetical protein